MRPEVGLVEPYVLPLILGQTPDAGRFVGNLDGEMDAEAGLHSVRVLNIRDQVVVFVRFFVGFGTPEYVVIVGRASI